MISFDGIPMRVRAQEDGRFPLPIPEEGTGIERYSAEIYLSSREDYEAMAALFSVVTIQLGMGFVNGGSAIIEAGPGRKTLIYPDPPAEITTQAVLVAWTPLAFFAGQNSYRVQASWLLVEAPA